MISFHCLSTGSSSCFWNRSPLTYTVYTRTKEYKSFPIFWQGNRHPGRCLLYSKFPLDEILFHCVGTRQRNKRNRKQPQREQTRNSSYVHCGFPNWECYILISRSNNKTTRKAKWHPQHGTKIRSQPQRLHSSQIAPPRKELAVLSGTKKSIFTRRSVLHVKHSLYMYNY